MLQRARHPDVAIYGDDAETHDGGSAAEHVHGGPDITKDLPEGPVVDHLQAGREGQHGGAEEKVGNGQVHDEIVGGTSEV